MLSFSVKSFIQLVPFPLASTPSITQPELAVLLRVLSERYTASVALFPSIVTPACPLERVKRARWNEESETCSLAVGELLFTPIFPSDVMRSLSGDASFPVSNNRRDPAEVQKNVLEK